MLGNRTYNLDDTQKFKAGIFKRILKSKNPLFNYTKVPKVFLDISRSKLIQYVAINNGDFLEKFHSNDHNNDYDDEYTIVVDDKDVKMAKYLKYQNDNNYYNKIV